MLFETHEELSFHNPWSDADFLHGSFVNDPSPTAPLTQSSSGGAALSNSVFHNDDFHNLASVAPRTALVATSGEDPIVIVAKKPPLPDLDGGGLGGGGSTGGGATGGGGGGGGGGPTPGATAGIVHSTPEHHTYIVNINLTAQQTQVLDQIVDYGLDHGYTAQEINVVATDAFYESSFSQAAVNGSHSGLFQYDAATWAANKETGSLTSAADQIAAAFNDMHNYESRYSAALSDPSNGLAASGLTFGQYFEIKHELGNNSTTWNAVNPVTGNTYVSDWQNSSNTLGIH